MEPYYRVKTIPLYIISVVWLFVISKIYNYINSRYIKSKWYCTIISGLILLTILGLIVILISFIKFRPFMDLGL